MKRARRRKTGARRAGWWWGIGLLATAVLFVRLVRYALRLPEFVDETIAVESAANFLSSGDYTSDLTPGRFDPGASSGFLATWPGGLGWLLTGRMLGARLAAGAVVWAQGMFLAWLFLRRQGLERGRAFCGAASLCLVATCLPLGVSFLWSLGEIPGAIWVGLGLGVIARRPLLAFFCLGLAVWQGKLLYLVEVACLFVGWWLATRQSREGRAPWPLAVAAFFLPLLLWMAVIWARYDAATVVDWLHRFATFVQTGHSGLQAEPGEADWKSRLALHGRLWSDFPMRTKLVVVLLTAGPAVLLVWLRARQTEFRGARLHPMLLLSTVAAVLIYAVWFFLFDPFLWLRHLLPALCLGFGSLVYMVYTAPALWRRSLRS